MKSTPLLLTGAKPIHIKIYLDCFWSSCRGPEISNKHQKYICKYPKNLGQLSLKPLTRKLATLFFADVHFNSADADLTRRKQAQRTKRRSLCTPQISSMVSECVHSPVTCATTAWEILLFPRNALISSFTMLLSLLQTHPAQVRTQKYLCSSRAMWDFIQRPFQRSSYFIRIKCTAAKPNWQTTKRNVLKIKCPDV